MRHWGGMWHLEIACLPSSTPTCSGKEPAPPRVPPLAWSLAVAVATVIVLTLVVVLAVGTAPSIAAVAVVKGMMKNSASFSSPQLSAAIHHLDVAMSLFSLACPSACVWNEA